LLKENEELKKKGKGAEREKQEMKRKEGPDGPPLLFKKKHASGPREQKGDLRKYLRSHVFSLGQVTDEGLGGGGMRKKKQPRRCREGHSKRGEGRQILDGVEYRGGAFPCEDFKGRLQKKGKGVFPVII